MFWQLLKASLLYISYSSNNSYCVVFEKAKLLCVIEIGQCGQRVAILNKHTQPQV